MSSYVPAPPPPPPPRRRIPRARGGGPRPLFVALGAAALAVLFVCAVGFALLLLRGNRHATPQEVVGAAIPPTWVPGRGGVGAVPPLPPGGPSAPTGAPAPLPSKAAPPDDQPPLVGDEQAPPSEQPAEPPPAPVAPPAEPPQQEAVFVPPRLIDLPTPDYPAIGERMRVQGTVTLQVIVAPDGHVLEANPVGQPLGMGFEAAARRAAFGAKFEPARRNGEAVTGETRIAIRFRLQ